MSIIIKNEKPRVLLIYREMIPSIIISALKPLQLLQTQGRILFEHAGVKSAKAKKLLLWCDITVCARNCFGDELFYQLRLRQLRIPYIYDCDDNFLRLQYSDDPSVAYLRWPGSTEAVMAFICGAHAIKVGSEQLVMDLTKYNQNCILLPYCFDMRIIADLHDYKKADDEVLIGYAGSITHTIDIGITTDAISSILKQYPNVSIISYGISIAGLDAFKRQVTLVPYLDDYSAFLRDFASRGIDIAIAPLYNNAANRSKTNNKYREYGACGIAGIYSDMPVYNSCIRDGDNGLLCANDTREWAEAICRLITDRPLRQHIVQRAKEDIIANYSVDAAAEAWLSKLLLPAFDDSDAVPYCERRSIVFRRGYQRIVWARKEFATTRTWMLFWLLNIYTSIRGMVKIILRHMGILPMVKRIKTGRLDKRLRAIKPNPERGKKIT